ncbi:MAG: alpha-glucosidase C-terminal domain-containing protein, partial [Rhodothermales bacterium]|nr:alpha-glucosidase C-terminal domain-containing protein [Rhodothermales bacterium]
DAEDAVVFERTDGSDRVLVVVNVRDRAVTLPVPEVLRGDYADALGGDAVALGETLELAPYAYHVLQPAD